MSEQEKNHLNFNLLFSESTIFLTVQIFGLLSGYWLFKDAAVRMSFEAKPITPFSYLAGFLIATAFYLIFIKLVKKAAPFKIFFFTLFFYSAYLTLSVWLSDYSAAFATALLFSALYIYPRVLLYDLIIILTIVGMSIVLGLSMTPWQMMILISLLSVYDFIAVYKTKHMVEIFRGLAARGVIMAIIIPSKFRGFLSKIAETNPGEDFLFLGTGDLAFPVAFAVSVLKYGLASSLLVIAGALLGVIFLYLRMSARKERRPAAALPPIAVGSILGFLISLLFS